MNRALLMLLVLWATLNCAEALIAKVARQGPRNRGFTPTGRLFMATSSSELKKQRPQKASPSPSRAPTSRKRRSKSTDLASRGVASVADRLSQAAKRASEKKKQRQMQELVEEDTVRDNDEKKTRPLACLQQLTQAIDKRLRAGNNQVQSRDSMTNVFHHNQNVIDAQESSNKGEMKSDIEPSSFVDTIPVCPADRHVAIVLGKPLQQDRLTLEYANRIRHLVQTMIKGNYRPDVICFVGPQSPGNILADADVGYMYFVFLAAAYQLPMAGIDIHLVKGSVQYDGALQKIVFFLQETCLPAWLRAANTRSPEDQNGSRSKKNPLDRRLRVHFSLISSEYELCQLNDIHLRSPGQSVLRALESWSQRSFVTAWSYMYVTTVARHNQDSPAQAFLSKTYKTAQSLVPVIQNLKNVVHNREFFQVESYRVLVAARRSMVSDMESLYQQQPQLKTVHNWRGDQPVSCNRPVDVVLEGALLLLGRCVDLVRPAGLLTGAPVTLDDWKLALAELQQAFDAITSVCDPDRPLEPEEWLDLEDGDDLIDDVKQMVDAE